MFVFVNNAKTHYMCAHANVLGRLASQSETRLPATVRTHYLAQQMS